jgi:hypothetical protein
MDHEQIYSFGQLALKAKRALEALDGFQIYDDKLLAYPGEHGPVAYGWFVKYRDVHGNCVILKICKNDEIILEGQEKR